MKRSTALSRLADVADGLDQAAKWPNLSVVSAYVFGLLLEPGAELEVVQLALVVDEPADGVPWMSRPAHLESLASTLRFDKLPLSWCWRPTSWPVWNHEITRAVCFWSAVDGRDEPVFAALAAGEVDATIVDEPDDPTQLDRQLKIERAVSRRHLATVTDSFYDREWRRQHTGYGVHPEDHLWWAATGYLELDNAVANFER